MTEFNAPSPTSAPPSGAAIKEAFARCYVIEDLGERSEALAQLERDNPLVAAEVRSLLAALQSSEKVNKVSAFVPMLDLRLESAPERLGDLSVELDSADPANFSVLRSIGATVASVPHVVLKSSGEEEHVVKVRSSEVDQTWNMQDGRYRLDGEIARGGMGAILKGRDTDLGRDLAIKVLLKEHQENPDAVKRFVEEAQIGGQLQHPGIAPVYELGQFSDQRPFFTMKLIKGKTLAELLRERKTVADDRIRFLGVFEQICQTMAYAHSRGVLHRDLKPSNVMVSAFGEVQVMDWGLAKVLAAGGVADERTQCIEEEKSLIQTVRSVGSGSTRRDDSNTVDGSATRMGSIMGTPAYMSPEQAAGEIDWLDQRTDVFSLGSILCEILTGTPVYRRDKQVDPLVQARKGDLRGAFERLDTSLADAELGQLAKDCLAIDKTERPSDAQAVSERISEYLQSVDQRLREKELEVARTKTKAEEERKRRRVVVALAGCIVLAVVLGAGGWMWVQEKETQLAKIKADAEIVAAAERSELEQRVQSDLAAASALATESGLEPAERELERSMEALRRAKTDVSSAEVSVALASQVDELLAQVSQQQADQKFVQRLRQIWELEQQYFAEKDLPPVLERPSSDGSASNQPAGGDVFTLQIINPAIHYEQAFAKWGFLLHETSQGDLGSWLERLPAAYRTSVIASLDRWRQLLDEDLSLSDWAQQEWSFLTPTEFRSSGDDEFRVLPDESILVSGPEPNLDHRITFETEATEISALRLEALLDDSLPNSGPGRGPGGMFDLQRLQVSVAPRTDPENFVAVEFADGAADYADVNWPFQVSRWRTWGGGGRPHVAYFRFSETISHPDGFRIQVASDRVLDGAIERGTLGRFRWSATRLDDHLSEKASLESLLAGLDTDPWRKQLRKALNTADTTALVELASISTAVQEQPSIVLAQLANSLMSYTGSELEALLPADSDFQVVHPTDVTSDQGTEYVIGSDGTIEARGNNPSTELTTVVLPAEAIESTTRLIRIELLGVNDDVQGSYISRRRFVRLREISISQASKERSRSVLSRVFSNYPFSISLAKIADGDLDTAMFVPIPDHPRVFYLDVDPNRLAPDQPLEIRLHTGSTNFQNYSNPARLRIAVSSQPRAFSYPFDAAEQLLMRMATARPSDPLVQLQLARYYKSSIPARTEDALRHAMIASSMLQDSIVPSLAFIDMLESSYLIDNPPLRQIAIEHVRRVEARHPEGMRTLRLRLAIEAAILEEYAQGNDSEAEQLMEFALASLSGRRKLFIGTVRGLNWDELSVDSICDSLIRTLARSFSGETDHSELASYCNLLGVAMYRSERLEQALKIFEKSIAFSPGSTSSHSNLGNCQLRLGRFDDAAKAFQSAVEIDPLDFPSRFGLGAALWRLKKLDEAFSEFRRAAELATNGAGHHKVGGFLASAQSLRLDDLQATVTGAELTSTESGRPISTLNATRAVEEGIFHFKRAIVLSPDDLDIVRDLGVAYYRSRKWQQAVDQLEQYEQLAAGEYDRNRWHLFLLAMAHWRLGNEDASYRYFGLGSVWVSCMNSADEECQRIRRESSSLMELDSIDQRRLKDDGYALWKQALEQVIASKPNDERRWAYRGRIHFIMLKNQDAVSDFSKAIELNPRDPHHFGNRGGAYHRLGQLELALKDRIRSVELEPWSGYRYFERAAVYRDLGKFRLAVDDIEKGFQADSIYKASWFTRAKARTLAGDICLLNLNQVQEAVRHYDQAIELDADYFTAFRGRAHAYWQIRQFKQALSDINRSLAIEPEDPVSFGIRGYLHQELGELDLALDDRNKAVQFDPTNNARYFERARTRRIRGEFEKALEDIQKGLEVDPNGDTDYFTRAAAYNLAGDIYLDDLGQLEKARGQYAKALRLDPSLKPNTPDSRMPDRGHSLYESGHYERAISCLTKAIEGDPENEDLVSLVSRRADSYRQLQQLDLALDGCNLIVELDPDCNARYFERARVHCERGEYQLAIADIEKGFELDPDRDHWWFTRASALELAGHTYLNDLDQPKQALEQYDKALTFLPSNKVFQEKRDEAAQAVRNSGDE